ncbi:hypothetical protein BJX63DRAFT_438048 [Aspergillus granulosus]|uniref:C2H2-type domain-containing protein n=1 Tax=Aspergillus granulosus TaxID=176169 RepID=A0ABR4GT63_9EURO
MSSRTRLSYGDYLIGWVCALPLEMAAASVMLDEVHQPLPQSPNDSNSYMLGRIGNHNIVIACLPAGIYGVISATASVVQMRFTFPQIQSALMVGIGGGAPTPDVDIRLGDVVVSIPTGTSGAVVQYDYGKTTAGGQFERVGVLDKPPPLFLTAVAQLQAKYMVGKGQISHIVSRTLEENAGMKDKFSCPGERHDVLYHADYDHPAPNNTCALCDNGRIVNRDLRRESEPLRIHYGLIASGNQVIKDGPTRDLLAKQLGILCFEMEAAGLMDQVPCLVIRGISDYSDSHKNKNWQGYAALTAAAYAKELLLVVNERPCTRVEGLQVSNIVTNTRTSYSPQAKHLISGAYTKLRKTVERMYYGDSVAFSDMSIEDVYQKARALERELAKSQSLRNMRRIVQFIQKLREYSKTIDKLCADTPYLSWLWAPVGLLLQVSSEDLNALDRLLEAYKLMAEILPTLTMLDDCKRNAENQKILALIYVDVLDLHQGLFEVFHGKTWKALFMSNWKESEDRRALILNNVVELCECMTRRSDATSINDIMDRRERRFEEWKRAEQARTQSRLESVLAWLDVKDGQEDELDRLHALQWREAGRESPVIWLTGKPGAGKSVLSASIIHTLKHEPGTEVPYYFCSYGAPGPTTYTSLLKALTAQLVRGNPSRAAYIHRECIQKGLLPSNRQMKQVLNVLFATAVGARIVIDGVDELESGQQEEVLNYLTALTSTHRAESDCKVLISSRDTGLIAERIGNSPTIHLREASAVHGAIKGFVHHELSVLRSIFGITNNDDTLEELETEIINKADGMFLWVRLVLSSLRRAVTFAELREIILKLPKGLEQTYRRIVDEILGGSSESQKAIKLRILFWMIHGKKPLKKYELLGGASIHRQNVDFGEQTRLQDVVLRQCKPLLEEGIDDTIRFVHFTAHEYFVRGPGSELVPPAQAHFGISFACLAYLTGGLNLVDPTVPVAEMNNQVARGLHSVCRYTYDNWLHHFQYCLDNSDKLTGGQLNILLAQFQKLHHRLRGLRPSADQPTEVHPLSDIFQHAELVKRPFVAQFLQESSDFHQTMEKKSFPTGDEADKFRLQNDPTLLSEMAQTYSRIMQSLYTATEAHGVTKEQLIKFKHQFGHLVYMCRFADCRSTFSSAANLQDHESTRHTGGIRCTEPSCPFSRIGFQSSKALKAHLRAHHNEEQAPTRVRVIRKDHKCNGCSQRFRLETELRRHQESRAGTTCGRSESPAVNDPPNPPMMTRTLPSTVEQRVNRTVAELPTASIEQQNSLAASPELQVILDQCARHFRLQGPFIGWRAEISVKDRMFRVYQMITSLFGLELYMGLTSTASFVTDFEERIFREAKDREEYIKEFDDQLAMMRFVSPRQTLGTQIQESDIAQREPWKIPVKRHNIMSILNDEPTVSTSRDPLVAESSSLPDEPHGLEDNAGLHDLRNTNRNDTNHRLSQGDVWYPPDLFDGLH